MRDKSEPWIKKSLPEKRKAVIDSHHEPPVQCLLCEVKVMPQDVWKHDERCAGKQDPHRLDKWLSMGEASEKVPAMTLLRLAAAGVIRARAGVDGQEYLVRDVWHAARGAELFAVGSEAHEVESASEGLSRLQVRILEALEAGAMTEGALRKVVRRNDRDVGRALRGLIGLGRVSRRYRRTGRIFERAAMVNEERAAVKVLGESKAKKSKSPHVHGAEITDSATEAKVWNR